MDRMFKLLLTIVSSLALFSNVVVDSCDVCKSTSSCLNGGVKKCTFTCLEGEKQQVECRCECPCGFIGVQCESRTGEDTADVEVRVVMTTSAPDEPTTQEIESRCYEENELLVASFRRGGENWRILPDGTVRTITFNGLVYKMASDGNLLFYTDDTGARLTRVDLCNITDERVIARVKSMAQSIAVDPDLKRVFVVEEPYEYPTPIPNTAVLSFDYEGNDKKTIVQDADNINDIAIDHRRKKLFWINTVSGSPSRIEAVHYGVSLQENAPSTVVFEDSSVYASRMAIDLNADHLYWITSQGEIWQMNLASYSEVSAVVSRPYGSTSVYGLVKVGEEFIYCNNRRDNYAVWSVKADQEGYQRVKYTNYSFLDGEYSGGLYGLHKIY